MKSAALLVLLFLPIPAPALTPTGGPFSDGTVEVRLSAEEKALLREYAETSRTRLQKAVEEGKGKTLSEANGIYLTAVKEVVRASHRLKPGTELLLRHILNQAMEITVGIPSADGSRLLAPGPLSEGRNQDLVTVVLEDSIQLALRYFTDDRAAIEEGLLTRLPFLAAASERLLLGRHWISGVVEPELQVRAMRLLLKQWMATASKEQRQSKARFAQEFTLVDDILAGREPQLATSASTGSRARLMRGHLRRLVDSFMKKNAGPRASAREWHRSAALDPRLFAQLKILAAKEQEIADMDVSPTGTLVALAAGTRARLVDFMTGAPHAHLKPHSEVIDGIHFSADGRFVLTHSEYRIQIADTRSGMTLNQIPRGPSNFARAIFLPDCKRILYATTDLKVFTQDLSGGKAELVLSLREGNGQVSALAASPDGRWIAAARYRGGITLRDLNTQREMTRPTLAISSARSIAFSPDSQRIAVAAGSFFLEIYDVETNSFVAGTAHEANLHSIAFSPDGQMVVAGANFGMAMVWDASSAALITALSRVEVPSAIDADLKVGSAKFSGDGTRILLLRPYADGISTFSHPRGHVQVWGYKP